MHIWISWDQSKGDKKQFYCSRIFRSRIWMSILRYKKCLHTLKLHSHYSASVGCREVGTMSREKLEYFRESHSLHELAIAGMSLSLCSAWFRTENEIFIRKFISHEYVKNANHFGRKSYPAISSCPHEYCVIFPFLQKCKASGRDSLLSSINTKLSNSSSPASSLSCNLLRNIYTKSGLKL